MRGKHPFIGFAATILILGLAAVSVAAPEADEENVKRPIYSKEKGIAVEKLSTRLSHGVDVVAETDSCYSGTPGDTVHAQFTIINTGTVVDTYYCWSYNALNWFVYPDEFELALNPGQDFSFVVDVYIPTEAEPGDTNMIIFGAGSLINMALDKDTICVEVILPPTYGVDVTAGPDTFGMQGDTVPVTFNILNTGDVTDTYDVMLVDTRYWNLYPTEFNVTLEPSGDTTVSINVSIPSATSEGIVDTIGLKATSLNSPDPVYDADSLTVTTIDTLRAVWVDDDYGPDEDNDGHTWQYDAFNKIQDAIDAVCECCSAVVNVNPGTYEERLTLKECVTVCGTCTGCPPICDSLPIIDGNGQGPVITVSGTGGVAIKCLWIKNGAADKGAGIYVVNSEDINIDSCCISNNVATSKGGGIYYENSSGKIDCNHIFTNTAESGAGIALSNTDAKNIIVINNVADNGNNATLNGGGIAIEGSGIEPSTRIENNRIQGNVAAQGAGISVTSEACPLITKNSIGGPGTGNQATAGGGVYVHGDGTDPTIDDNRIQGNKATNGGGMFITDRACPDIFVDNDIGGLNVGEGNEATEKGGGILIWGEDTRPLIFFNNIKGNKAKRGAGISVQTNASPHIEDNTIEGNVATEEAGAIYCQSANLHVEGNTIKENKVAMNQIKGNKTDNVVNEILCELLPENVVTFINNTFINPLKYEIELSSESETKIEFELNTFETEVIVTLKGGGRKIDWLSNMFKKDVTVDYEAGVTYKVSEGNTYYGRVTLTIGGTKIEATYDGNTYEGESSFNFTVSGECNINWLSLFFKSTVTLNYEARIVHLVAKGSTYYGKVGITIGGINFQAHFEKNEFQDQTLMTLTASGPLISFDNEYLKGIDWVLEGTDNQLNGSFDQIFLGANIRIKKGINFRIGLQDQVFDGRHHIGPAACVVIGPPKGTEIVIQTKSQGSIAIRNCMFTHITGIGSGIELQNIESAVIENNIFLNNAVGILSVSSNPIINHNTFSGNTEFAVQNIDPSVTVNALYNWWGHESGPYHPTTNPSGQGDPVSDHVNYNPWLNMPITLAVTAGQDAYGFPGDTVLVDFYIRNFKNLTEIYDVMVTDSLGWDLEPDSLIATLDSLADTVILVAATIPPDATIGTVDTITLTAISQTYTFATDSDWLTVTVGPSIPTLLEPPNGTFTNDNTPTFNWYYVPDDTRYHLQVSNDTLFESPIIDDSTLMQSTYTPDTLLVEGLYFWRMRTGMSYLWSGWSDTWNFMIDTEPPTFDSTTVWTDTSFGGPYAVTSIVKDTLSGIDSVFLYYRSEPDNEWSILSMESIDNHNLYSAEIPEAVDTATIDYYLSATDRATNTATDPTDAPNIFYSFKRLGIAEQVKPIPMNFALLPNTPNPFTFVTTIKYQLPTKSYISIKVYDFTGRLVCTLTDESKEAGYHAVSWDGQDDYGRKVAVGVYFYKLEAHSLEVGKYRAIKKMILLK
jgi:parallel beta-helix repeat protein